VRTTPAAGRKKKAVAETQGSLFPEEATTFDGMAGWAERYLGDVPFDSHGSRQTELREYLISHDRAGEELVARLVAWFEQGAEEERFDAALRLLHDVFEILRIDLERRRPEAALRMEGWQAALARQVFAEGVEPHLGALVTQVLLSARIEILPLLHALI
jgi:hypothetical protein